MDERLDERSGEYMIFHHLFRPCRGEQNHGDTERGRRQRETAQRGRDSRIVEEGSGDEMAGEPEGRAAGGAGQKHEEESGPDHAHGAIAVVVRQRSACEVDDTEFLPERGEPGDEVRRHPPESVEAEDFRPEESRDEEHRERAREPTDVAEKIHACAACEKRGIGVGDLLDEVHARATFSLRRRPTMRRPNP